MNAILVPVIVILSIVLIAIVLVQKSKGGGLAAGFQSANSTLGAPKTANFLEKASWSLMGIIAVLCIICTITTKKVSNVNASALQIMEGTQMEMNENIADDAAADLSAEEAE